MNPFIVLMIKTSGRSWWQARYSDGRVLSEWDTLTGINLLPVGLGRSSRWEEVPKEHMVGLRLLCPNGMAGELEASDGFPFFQLKQGYLDVGPRGGNRTMACQIIGVLANLDGDCRCRAWETEERRLITFTDNVFNMKYRKIGRLNLDVQGVRL